MPGISLLPEIDPADGYLNVVVVRQATLRTLGCIIYTAFQSVVSGKKEWGERTDLHLFSIHAKEISVAPRPVQIAARDGEEIESGFPLLITVEPNSLLVVTPKRKTIS